MSKQLAMALVLTCGVGLTACATTSAPVVQSKPWASLIDASANFYQVDDKLYRSEQLTEQDIALVRQTGINTIVNLRFFDRNDDKQAFKNQPITLINTPLLTWSIQPKDLALVLHTIRQAQDNGPVLVHCYHGADRTGVVVAMYRIIYQDWAIDEAKAEMQQGDFGYHSIWKNIDRLLSEKNVAKVREALTQLQSTSTNNNNPQGVL